MVFSVDALVHEDISYLFTKPNFKKYLFGGVEVEKITSIYPTVTYPIHVSLITGCYPEKHGVISNFKFSTGNKEQNWNWFADAINVEDLFTASKHAGYSTASVFWPVTGCHPDIDYLLNEYWMPFPDDTLESAFRRSGTSDEVIAIADRNKDLLPNTYTLTGRLNMMVQPFIDDFLIACSCDIIRQFAPEVLFVHNGIMDSTRHKNGVFNDRVTSALDRVDLNLGQLTNALEDINLLDQTNIVVLSDHGQMDFNRIIKPNVYLAEKGFIDISNDGQIRDWQAFSMSNAMSTMVFLKEPNDPKLYNAVYTFLKDLVFDGNKGFSKVFTREEVKSAEHLDGDFSFVLETDDDTSFSDDYLPPLINDKDLSDFRYGHATHGYLPCKGPQPVFLAKGPDFRKDITIEHAHIVDIAPTLAELLNIKLKHAQGSSMQELLRDRF